MSDIQSSTTINPLGMNKKRTSEGTKIWNDQASERTNERGRDKPPQNTHKSVDYHFDVVKHATSAVESSWAVAWPQGTGAFLTTTTIKGRKMAHSQDGMEFSYLLHKPTHTHKAPITLTGPIYFLSFCNPSDVGLCLSQSWPNEWNQFPSQEEKKD